MNDRHLLEGFFYVSWESSPDVCCVAGSPLDQAGFSNQTPQLCLMRMNLPTGQMNLLTQDTGWGGVGWGGWAGGSQACKLNKRGDGLLRLWSRAEASFSQLYQILSCFALYWFSGVLNAEYPLSGSSVLNFQHSAHIFSTAGLKVLIFLQIKEKTPTF